MTEKNDTQITHGRQRNQYLCPHCNSNARIRISRRLSPLYMDGILECQNIAECGWRGRYGTELLATLTPSAMPSPPDINLPISPYVLPSSQYALPQKLRHLTKNPFDSNRDQLPLFGNEKLEQHNEH